MTVTRRIRRRGEHGISRKTIVQGMPDEPGEPVVTAVCLLPFAHGLRVDRTPGIPCALCLLGANDFLTTRVRIAPREAKARVFDRAILSVVISRVCVCG